MVSPCAISDKLELMRRNGYGVYVENQDWILEVGLRLILAQAAPTASFNPAINKTDLGFSFWENLKLKQEENSNKTHPRTNQPTRKTQTTDTATNANGLGPLQSLAFWSIFLISSPWFLKMCPNSYAIYIFRSKPSVEQLSHCDEGFRQKAAQWPVPRSAGCLNKMLTDPSQRTPRETFTWIGRTDGLCFWD